MQFANNLDVAQLAIWAFWFFFAGLVYYLRREDKREGYPLHTQDVSGTVQGWPPYPGQKQFIETHTGNVSEMAGPRP
jgi:photosynthetic reaction center H subunit